MKRPSQAEPDAGNQALTAELLLLPDGRILVHNLTPAFAALLQKLDLADETLPVRLRSASIVESTGTSEKLKS